MTSIRKKHDFDHSESCIFILKLQETPCQKLRRRIWVNICGIWEEFTSDMPHLAAYLCLSALLWRNHDDNHDALSPERAVARFRIAAVLCRGSPRAKALWTWLRTFQRFTAFIGIGLSAVCPYWQQAGAADYKRYWCERHSRPVCQLRKTSHWSRTFFSMFSFPENIKKSKYRK